LSQRDLLHRFLFTHAEDEHASSAGGARGELVQLEAAWQSIRSRGDYPPVVANLLGQAAVATVLLAATLKIDGKLTLQVIGEHPRSPPAGPAAQSPVGGSLPSDPSGIHAGSPCGVGPSSRSLRSSMAEAPAGYGPRDQPSGAGQTGQGDGAIHLLVMQVTSSRELRGLARWHGDVPVEVEGGGLSLMGDGRLVMTIETARGERYQGIVPLEGANLAQALEGYFERSEQLSTRLWLEASETRAAGLLVQKMPGQSGTEVDEDWRRIVALSETVTRGELLDLPAETLLHRLFHEEDRRVFEPEPVRFACSCSRGRVAEMLRSLGRDEVEQILAEQGQVEVDCEFCNARYTFDAVDAAAVFVDSPHPGAECLH